MNVKALEYYGKLKERTLETIKYINTEDESILENIEKMTRQLYTLNSPILLDGSQNSYMIQLEKEQNQMYASLEELGIQNPENLSLLKFNSLIEKKEDDNMKAQQKSRRNGQGRA